MSAQRKEELIKFVEEKCEDKKVLIVMEVAREFKEKNPTAAKIDTLRKAIRTYSKEKVPGIQDEGKRAKQLFALSVRIDDNLMNKLQTCATVTLDSDQKIVKYVSHDGLLILEGDQSLGGKMKMVHKKMAAAVKKEEDASDTADPPAPKRTRVSTPGSSTSANQSSTTSSSSSSALLATQILEANQKNADLQKEMEALRRAAMESNSDKRNRIGYLEKVVSSQDVHRRAFSTTLENYRANAAKHQKEKQELEKEKMEMKMENEKQQTLHNTEVESLKKEAADDLKKMEGEHNALVAKLQAELAQRTEEWEYMRQELGKLVEEPRTSAPIVPSAGGVFKEEKEESKAVKEATAENSSKTNATMSSELEAFKKVIEQLKMKKEENEQNKKEKAILQKKIDELLLNQEMLSRIMSGAAQMLKTNGNMPSTSNDASGFMEQLKIRITEEIKDEEKNAGQHEAQSVEEKTNESDEDPNSA